MVPCVSLHTGAITRAVKQHRDPVPVLFVRSASGPAGSAAAFEQLESRLPTLRGRKFFATCRGEDYRACVKIQEGDDLDALGLEVGEIPGGAYARARLEGGPENIAATFARLASEHAEDPTRPCIEFYRREGEVILLMPVRDP